MTYEEMKATKKSSKSDSAKNAISAALGSISKPKTSGTKKSSNSSTTSKTNSKTSNKTSQTKKQTSSSSKSGTKSRTNNTSSNKKISTSKKKEPSLVDVVLPAVAIATSNQKSKNLNTENKNINKKSKSGLAFVLIVLFLGIGIIGGFFATKFICANDVYEMNSYANGEVDLIIGENESIIEYTELGVKCIAFGKDYSNDYQVTYYFRNKLTEDEIEVSKVGEKGEGIYYAVYSSPAVKYKTVTLIRNIIVLRGEDDA